jgi:hypothetical protein
MKSFIRVAGLLLLTIGSSAVMALPISGNITFLGTSNVAGTAINFTSANVALVDGDYVAEGVATGNAVAFSSFDYAANPFTTVAGLWAVGGFSFNLESITVGVPTAGVDLSLNGKGTLSHANYDDTVMYWEYSGNYFGNTTLQVFSSAVPEPSALALLGLGLIGFGFAGYGRKRT